MKLKTLHPLRHPIDGRILNVNLYSETNVAETFKRIIAEQQAQLAAAYSVPESKMRRVK